MTERELENTADKDGCSKWTGYASKEELESLDMTLAEAMDDIYALKRKMNDLSYKYYAMGWYLFFSLLLVLLSLAVLYYRLL